MIIDRFRENTQEIHSRKSEVSGLLGQFINRGFVTRRQLAGKIMDLFSYTGTVGAALRPYGGSITLVEKNGSYLEMGMEAGLLSPSVDTIVNGPVEKFLAEETGQAGLSDVITCFGTAFDYFENMYRFIDNARKKLKPDGTLIMTGAENMRRPFEDFVMLFGGRTGRLNPYSFTWDAYYYYFKNSNHPNLYS